MRDDEWLSDTSPSLCTRIVLTFHDIGPSHLHHVPMLYFSLNNIGHNGAKPRWSLTASRQCFLRLAPYQVAITPGLSLRLTCTPMVRGAGHGHCTSLEASEEYSLCAAGDEERVTGVHTQYWHQSQPPCMV